MKYLNYLKNPAMCGGALLLISLLTFRGLDKYALILSAATFVVTFIYDLGKEYLNVTNQSKFSKDLFKTITEPLFAVTALLGIFYVFTGSFHVIFLGVCAFIAFILFAVNASELINRKQDS